MTTEIDSQPLTQSEPQAPALALDPCSAFPGMKTRPKYYGTEGWELLMGGAWVALCNYALGIEEHRKAFAAETGHDLMALVNRDPLAALIDKATGRESVVMAAWCDWVTRNLWGEEDSPNRR